jgi:hypothetical protein
VYIDGSLEIVDNGALVSFSGMGNLVSVGGSFLLLGNSRLEDFSGLDNLSIIDEDFVVAENGALENFIGLSKLDYVGALQVDANDSLEDFEGLGPSFGMQSIHICLNPQLSDLSAVRDINLKHLTELIIEGNGSLLSLDGLDLSLSMFLETVDINSNERLRRLEGLNDLEYVRYHLMIKNNPSLSTLGDLENLVVVGLGLTVTDNISLPTCEICDLIKNCANQDFMTVVYNNLADNCVDDEASESEMICSE